MEFKELASLKYNQLCPYNSDIRELVGKCIYCKQENNVSGSSCTDLLECAKCADERREGKLLHFSHVEAINLETFNDLSCTVKVPSKTIVNSRVSALAAIGNCIVVGSETGEIAVVNEEGESVSLLKHKAEVIRIMPINEESFLTTAEDSQFIIWNLPNRKPVKYLSSKLRIESSCLIDADRVAVGSTDGKIEQFQLTTGDLISTVDAHKGNVHELCKLGNSNIVSAGADKKICLWNWNEGTLLKLVKVEETVVKLRSIGKSVVIAGMSNGLLQIWDMRSEVALRSLKTEKGSFKFDVVKEQALIIDSQGSAFIYGKDGEHVRTLARKYTCAAEILWQNNRVVLGGVDGSLSFEEIN